MVEYKVAKCTCQIMVELKTRLLNVHVKSWLNTLKDKVAKCTCQIMVENA